MRFSSRFGAAIHMLLLISEYSKTQKVTSDFIAEKMGINAVTVRRRLGVLKKAGFIHIAPRREKEGTIMARPLTHITLHDIFEVTEPETWNDLYIPNTMLANRTSAGVFVNEIITECLDLGMSGLRKEFEIIRLSDILLRLEDKAAACGDPEALFPNLMHED